MANKLNTYRMDLSFYSFDIVVKAKTKGEARKKALQKLAKTNMKKHINKNISYLSKED